MKILRISLNNLASLAGTHTVDFTQEPLRSAGLFAISGPTGSGKTTLLDALCLALYDDTPRLTRVSNKLDLPDGEKQNNPRNLLRRGAGDGWAEVAFVGTDQQTYTARWQVNRAGRRMDGKLQAVEMTLLQGNSVFGSREAVVVCGGKKTEVLAAITEKVGLSFEQFTRCVLLAQGEFAAFLKASEKERAEILEALTDSMRFANISRAVHERYSAEKQLEEQLSSKLETDAPLHPELRAQAEAAATEAFNALHRAKDAHQAVQKQLDWFTQLEKLTQLSQQAAEQVLQARKERAQAAPREAELLLTFTTQLEARPHFQAEQEAKSQQEATAQAQQKAQQAVLETKAALSAYQSQQDAVKSLQASILDEQTKAEPQLRQARELDAQWPERQSQHEQVLKTAQAAEAELEKLQQQELEHNNKLQTAEQKLQDITQRFAKQQSWLRFVHDAAAWQDRIQAAQKAQQIFSAAAVKLQAAQTAVDAAQSAVEQNQAKFTQTQQLAKLAKTSLQKATEILQKHDAAALQDQQKALHDQHLQFDTTLKALYSWQDCVQQLQGIDKDNQEAEAQLQSISTNKLVEAEKAVKVAEQLLRVVADATLELRNSLSQGQLCPVCGSAEHPYVQHPPEVVNAAAIQVLRKKHQDMAAECTSLREQAVAIRAAIAERTKQRPTLEEKLHKLKDELTEQRKKLALTHPETVAAINQNSVEGAISLLENEVAHLQKELKTCDKNLANYTKASAEREKLLLSHEQATTMLQEIEHDMQEKRSALQLAESTFAQVTSLQTDAQQLQKTADTALEPLLAAWPQRKAKSDDFNLLRQEFGAAVLDIEALQKEQEQAQKEHDSVQAALKPVHESVQSAQLRCEQAKHQVEAALKALDELKIKRAALLAGEAADVFEQLLLQKLQLAQQKLTIANQAYTDASAKCSTAEESLTAATAQLTKAQQHTQAKTTVLDVWLKQHHLTRQRLETILQRDDNWRNQETAAIQALDQAIAKAEGSAKTHEENIAKHQLSKPNIKDNTAAELAIKESAKALDTAQKAADETRLALQNDDLRRATAADLVNQLQRQRAKLTPYAKLHELIGSADGSKFRDIAQRRTLDLLLEHANVQLAMLSTRYELERIPRSLNLLVMDRDMGDERRGVHSLSGGETFLVSLALALGLASLTSNRLRIESLFIDEGFGNLDPDTLTMAMGALMQLEAQGRKVGVISHVSEMADAIPVQIKVQIVGRTGTSRLILPGGVAEPPRDVTEVEATVTQLLSLLEKAQEKGDEKVSLVTLRRELGCDAGTLQAARNYLGPRVVTEGKSLRLAQQRRAYR